MEPGLGIALVFVSEAIAALALAMSPPDAVEGAPSVLGNNGPFGKLPFALSAAHAPICSATKTAILLELRRIACLSHDGDTLPRSNAANTRRPRPATVGPSPARRAPSYPIGGAMTTACAAVMPWMQQFGQDR